MKIYNKKDFKEKYKDIDDKKFTDIYNFLKGKKTKIGYREWTTPLGIKVRGDLYPNTTVYPLP